MVIKYLMLNNVLCFCLYSIDAKNSNRLAKFVNDSPGRFANCKAKTLTVNSRPHLIIFATKPIMTGTELRYDYGSGTSNLPWRKVSPAMQIYMFKLMVIIMCI